jgi:hypothetical protein
MGKVRVLPDIVNNEALSPAKRAIADQSLKESGDKENVSEAAQFPVPVYQVIDGINHIIHSNKPAAITLGHNKDYQTKSQIAMVAGTLGSLVAENDPQTNNPIEVAHPTPTDAASVIVSEMADFGDYNGRSVVTAKADVVGLRSAELIELRTGGIPYLANGHQTTNKYGGIHLIAGNKTEGKDFDLQPMVKGENLQEMMVDMIESVQNLISQVKTLNNDVASLKTDLISHNHTVSLVGSVTATSPAGPVAGTANVFGATGSSLGLTTSLPPTIAKASATITTNLSGIDSNFTTMRQNYLEQFSPLPIKSRFNKVN